MTENKTHGVSPAIDGVNIGAFFEKKKNNFNHLCKSPKVLEKAREKNMWKRSRKKMLSHQRRERPRPLHHKKKMKEKTTTRAKEQTELAPSTRASTHVAIAYASLFWILG